MCDDDETILFTNTYKSHSAMYNDLTFEFISNLAIWISDQAACNLLTWIGILEIF